MVLDFSGSEVDTNLRWIVIENTLVTRLSSHQLTTSTTESFILRQILCLTLHQVSNVVRVGKGNSKNTQDNKMCVTTTTQ